MTAQQARQLLGATHPTQGRNPTSCGESGQPQGMCLASVRLMLADVPSWFSTDSTSSPPANLRAESRYPLFKVSVSSTLPGADTCTCSESCEHTVTQQSSDLSQHQHGGPLQQGGSGQLMHIDRGKYHTAVPVCLLEPVVPGVFDCSHQTILYIGTTPKYTCAASDSTLLTPASSR